MNTEDGVFLVHEAPAAADAPLRDVAYLAYWKDFAAERLFVYGRPVFTIDEVAEALAALQRDLSFDASEIVLSPPDLAEAWAQLGDGPIGDVGWSPATRNGLLGLMGFPVPTEVDLPDVAFMCQPAYVTSPPTNPRDPYDPRAPLQALEADPYLAPVQSPEDLFRWLEGYVACGGCSNPCGRNCCNGGSCCGGACCNGSCCNGRCCGSTAVCCSFGCCPVGGSCCAGECCDGPCCDTTGECCPAGGSCCNNECCDGPCCNGTCCESGETCCSGECCAGECCDGVCCPVGGSCCNGSCCAGPCCNGVCCLAGGSCCDGACCAGPCCEATDECCPAGGSCCNNECCAGPCCNGVCCAAGGSCCNGQCCPGPCCDGTCCASGTSCCGAFCCQGGESCCNPATGLCCASGNHCCPDLVNCCPNDAECCAGDCCGGGAVAGAGAEICCVDMCCADPNVCCNSECLPTGCSVSLSSATGKPCEAVNLTLTGDCWPDCGSMGFTLTPQYPPPYNTLVAPWLDISTPSGIACAGGAQTRTVSVTIHEDAPPGPVPIEVTATAPNGQQCQGSGTVTVDRTYHPIEIQYKTFIAPEVIVTPMHPKIPDFFAGDDRWFAYGTNSNRTFQSIVMTIDPAFGGGGVGAPTNAFGTTLGYDDDPDGSDVTSCAHCAGSYGDYCLVPGATVDCWMTAIPGVNGNILTIVPERVSGTEVKAVFSVHGANPCASGILGPDAPAIDATLTIHFRQVCQNGMLQRLQFRLYGSHDGFPWHEVYINGTRVYEHDPCCPELPEGPWSLEPPAEHAFEANDICHGPYTPPLNEWRQVPGTGP